MMPRLRARVYQRNQQRPAGSKGQRLDLPRLERDAHRMCASRGCWRVSEEANLGRLRQEVGARQPDPSQHVVLEEIDAAPISEQRHRQMGNLLERVVIIERGIQRGARVEQEAQTLHRPIRLDRTLSQRRQRHGTCNRYSVTLGTRARSQFRAGH
jgi:hypothetical protein